ncbi:DUF3667 domain-containing protein [Seongchinamella sediminis]|uniref:DUF3667 domain-containing protein n=1 Tax=Seongchinamella sediminis TaxID=2283635 RepID=A0A3L7E334_9GAMM|nr:DUF3667 domain-containing protein [Seongchinamella sediminis]RLQ23305.1 DUF3667 domain-containing protein [Seongchinamella sediminis]
MGKEGQYCRNCRARIIGEYCSECGQREGRADKRFLDLAGDLLGDVLDMDSRFWRTLGYLVFRPGFLSAEFMAGRRARYLPPLRLYLVISFIVFLVVSLNSAQLQGGESQAGDGMIVIGVDDDVARIPDEVDDPSDFTLDLGIADEGSPRWLQDAEQRIEGNAGKLRDDPNRFMEVMLDYLPQMMFLLLPVFALLVQLLYLGSAFHYLQHLVFALHYHSFVYLLYLLASLVDLLTLPLDGWLLLGLLIYLPLALRRTYDSGWPGALFKSLLVYVSYAVILVVGFAAVAVLALFLI